MVKNSIFLAAGMYNVQPALNLHFVILIFTMFAFLLIHCAVIEFNTNTHAQSLCNHQVQK